MSVREQRQPDYVLEHSSRATRWVRLATIFIVAQEEDPRIYPDFWGGGKEGVELDQMRIF